MRSTGNIFLAMLAAWDLEPWWSLQRPLRYAAAHAGVSDYFGSPEYSDRNRDVDDGDQGGSDYK